MVPALRIFSRVWAGAGRASASDSSRSQRVVMRPSSTRCRTAGIGPRSHIGGVRRCLSSGMAQPRALENFSLVLGGPLYQLWLRLRLLDPPVRYVERRVAAVVAVTWLPVLLLAALGGTLFGGATIPFFFDVDAHVRLLVALPLLIIAEPVVHWQLSMQVRQLEERGVIAPEDRGRFAAIIDETMRLRNSMAIELVILACALGLGYWI